jgi:hypothetical protein
LQSLNSTSSSPFFAAEVLEQQWKEIDSMLSLNTISAYDLAGKNVGVICYNGDTARVATSVLRARNITASSIKGGFQALMAQLPQLRTNSRLSFQQWSEASTARTSPAESNTLVTESGLGHEVLVNAP